MSSKETLGEEVERVGFRPVRMKTGQRQIGKAMSTALR